MTGNGLAALPVEAVLGDLCAALAVAPNAVLAAPPGAGKTTRVPLALADEAWCGGKIILIEPRRLAARAAARRMAFLLGEEVGETVGYRMRLETRVSARTRIEVVTEGVFTRMALDQPDLAGISLVIFDEFHERALEADFGLALALDIQSGLREDLRILVMSATLDTDRVALLIGGITIASQGRSHPVEIHHIDRPGGERIEETMARCIERMAKEQAGSILAFLPGQGEIARVAERISGRLGPGVDVMPLYGALSGSEQDAAIRPPAPGRRKIVLATPVAESSITIDGVTIVIDSGLVRQPVFEPSTGITRLETTRISRASADQRAGRAGRTAPGLAVRLWHAGQTAALSAFAPPQILASDLSGLVLDCAAWGVADPGELRFLDPPPVAAVAEARSLLTGLGALDAKAGLTEKGRAMRALALPPRLAAMVVAASDPAEAVTAAELAVLLTEQGLGGTVLDLDERLAAFRRDGTPRAKAARDLARRMVRQAGVSPKPFSGMAGSSTGRLLAEAFADRVAMQRGGRGRYVMVNGRGCIIDERERLAGARYLVVADLTGKAAFARVMAAAELSGDALAEIAGRRGVTGEDCLFDAETRSVRARATTRLGAIVLLETPIARPSGAMVAAALAEGVRMLGPAALPFTQAALQLRDRISFLHRSLGVPWPDAGNATLIATLDDWFIPFQQGVTSFRQIEPGSLTEGLKHWIGHSALRELDRLAPTHYQAPTGSLVPIRYDGAEPVLAIRVQELFGETSHPAIAGGTTPLVLELLSPAQRPLQTTRDLAGFWKGSWADVRSDMRGRYPRHSWPEDPTKADPTRRAKPRGT